MLWNRYVRILVVLGMVAVMFGTVSAATDIVAQTQAASVGAYPVCTAPCECMAESTAAARWGASGYEMCSKTLCGQSADAMVQYYCFHQVGSTVAAPAVTTTAQAAVPLQTVQAQVTSAAIPAAPSPAAPVAGITTKSPVGMITILAAIGAALLAAAGMRRK